MRALDIRLKVATADIELYGPPEPEPEQIAVPLFDLEEAGA